MRILFVADGRSPIAQSWIEFFVRRGDEVYLASTFACSLPFALSGMEVFPVAFSAAAGGARRGTTLGLRTRLRHLLGPLTISRAAQRLRGYIQKVSPGLIHALRIPFEGMLAADAYAGTPLIVSVWGNDFTLHAPASPLMKHYTRWTLKVADGLLADCQRDLRLARQWGFASARPALVVPGNGGVRTDLFHPPVAPVEAPVILNPRGVRGYVRNDIFFHAIPRVLEKYPQAKFLCAALAGDPQAEKWIQELKIGPSVELLAPVPHAEMAAVFRRAQLMVSPSVHDGTPNSLLEAMACGCLPVAGDLESIREWITPGRNGLLMDATDVDSVASAMLEGLANGSLRAQASDLNQKLIAERAEVGRSMGAAAQFYERVLLTAQQRS